MRALVLAGACAALLSCSSKSETPIPSTPLAGTIGGKAFTAKSARARKSSSNPAKKSITIYDVDSTCAATPSAADRWVIATAIWQGGAKQDPYSVGWYVHSTTGGVDTLYIADSSELEVVEAPTTVGSVGLIRIRASSKGDSIEGQIAVQVCE
jgi:hypothetical protein